ncbi:GNAT family N-acetyltransferase [Phyllobacterium zundukense]|uniref:GNAT family N-acetyltransferase n=1 Tax=Phyllobacterium zundukense TaxID=1867719 RepID=A0A2N9W467_9HYPH|nr:GNAT family N-acetyltransferase [Phyllobacterium zundukense]ATU91995.1 GNAT family N-acetyltransferase [Phyllobacterium zundukense]PIO46535.1 GNAT family N-acetyltransferase [Phyllobacterium zundukense]
MSNDTQTTISIFSADDIASHLSELGALLRACVDDGASIGFVLPFSVDDSRAFFSNNVLPAVRLGKRVLLVAYKNDRIAGSGQLDFDTPPNQPHRAEVRKLLVHPDFRRQGIAKVIMAELERVAGQLGRSLITLDTRTGDKAEPLYASLGYNTAGIIPGYCRDPFEDRLDSTTVMYKSL